MSTYRINRLFRAESGRCLNVAVDHGFFGETRFLSGIEDMATVVETLVEAGPDAIQLTIGQADLLQSRPGSDKPALVLRTDIANVYGTDPESHLFSRMIARPVEQAIRLDAACVVANLLQIPNRPDVRDACIANILAIKPVCDRYGMPLMIEPLVLRTPADDGAYAVDGDADKIVALVRQAVEMGADIIKADPTDDPAEYHRVIEVARVPVLVRGGGRVGDREILERTHTLIEQGAAGIVYGRNIIQHPRPAAITRALLDVVHNGASPEKAMTYLGADT